METHWMAGPDRTGFLGVVRSMRGCRGRLGDTAHNAASAADMETVELLMMLEAFSYRRGLLLMVGNSEEAARQVPCRVDWGQCCCCRRSLWRLVGRVGPAQMFGKSVSKSPAWCSSLE